MKNYFLNIFLPNTPMPKSPEPKRIKVAGSGIATTPAAASVAAGAAKMNNNITPKKQPNNFFIISILYIANLIKVSYQKK
jgi:hypothetical protein